MLGVDTMSSARHIALWLAAVIVTVAAAIMPCAALAHDGHGHARAARHVVVAAERSTRMLDRVPRALSDKGDLGSSKESASQQKRRDASRPGVVWRSSNGATTSPFEAVAARAFAWEFAWGPEMGRPIRSAGIGNAVELQAVRMSVEDSRLACACPACLVGTACGHAPSSCCATGIAPDSELLCPPSRVMSRLARRDGLPMPGIVPESLGEPPRSFA